jgi:uncharacterized protein YqfA (UPF0365 family)
MSIKNKIKSGKEMLNFFSEKNKFYRLANRIARNENTHISKDEINEIFDEPDTKLNFISTITEADKANAHITHEQAVNIIKNRKDNKAFKELITLYVKAKKAKINITPEEIIEIYKLNKNISKVFNAIIEAKKIGVNLTTDQVKTLFYNKSDNEKILDLFIKSKKFGENITAQQITTAFFSNINIEKFINIKTLIAKYQLEIPENILFDMLHEKTNIIKTVEILSKSKEECKEELMKLNFFSDKEADTLANTYIISGKEKFKKGLEDHLLKKTLLKDPAEIYLNLVKAPNNSFKYNFENIKPYLSFDFTANIDTLLQTYLKARKEGLHIKLEQIAEMAVKKVDVEKFFEAEIKNKAND